MTHPAVANGSYDVARVREDFPALALKVYGKPLVYLDNAASAQKPNAVLDRMTQAYTSEYANVHRGLHYLANAATEAYEGGRAKVAKFINAKRNEEIVFTRNATEAINLVASSWGEPNIREGDEIVLSIMEHHSNIVPWHRRIRKSADAAHQAGRDHADVECARHHRAGQGRREACP
jgi:cysteine desulfurase/selenocysteine lyase